MSSIPQNVLGGFQSQNDQSSFIGQQNMNQSFNNLMTQQQRLNINPYINPYGFVGTSYGIGQGLGRSIMFFPYDIETFKNDKNLLIYNPDKGLNPFVRVQNQLSPVGKYKILEYEE